MRTLSRADWAHVPPEQLRFIMAGKSYLLARSIYQLGALVWFAFNWRAGAAVFTGVNAAGVLLIMAGYALRRWARVILGERFRGWEVRREERGLEDGGPYRYFRHPGYIGLALMDLGWPLALGVPAALLLWFPLAWLMWRRVVAEEQLLRQAYPREYPAYAATRSRAVSTRDSSRPS